MGSEGRVPPPHLRQHPLPGPGIMHPDPFGSRIHPLRAAQHVEIEKHSVPNQRLSAIHGTLRQELAASQHEKQIFHSQIEVIESEREQQMRNLMDKIAKMEAELQSAEPVRLELQKARSEVENLVVVRQELVSKLHQLSQDLQRENADHHCRYSFNVTKPTVFIALVKQGNVPPHAGSGSGSSSGVAGGVNAGAGPPVLYDSHDINYVPRKHSNLSPSVTWLLLCF